ncbi:MinD-like ATPase involved in chromosome partitioning or flagellar assembly [Jatrophihabitans sp. GAS493]|uniref:AAA family ATPase n=1 Tax=Jatrophihabitans sp. GAS493 TaxID=1907575 RepID=UPI000BB81BF6|nr:chromosome partitioning protein [Jatrophihabitans sp. GAS493]SOD73150.1 MinD-like ATPase involved in chromosome partitioning or flagellar assembly [Jatrophihabitans sp. GAS493]
MKTPVLTAADGAEWEAGLVVALDRGDHDVSVVRRCVDIVDLLAVATTGQARAALVAAGLRRLDADAVDRLAAAEVAVVGVVRRGDDAAQERLSAIGVAFVVPDDADAAVVAAVIGDAIAAREGGLRAPRSFGDPTAATSMAIPPTLGATPVQLPTQRGSVIAVWGPTGAPGRTTVSVLVADELSRLTRSSLLIDADVYGGVVASVLGLLDESPGFAAACRQAGSARMDATALAALAWQLSPTLRVLTGLPRAERWPELRPAGVEAVLEAARSLADFTVVDCGFNLESDEELSFDTVAPRRNGATLAVLDRADVILAVGSADPIGMQRLVRGLAELRDAEVEAPVWVVLNRVRSSAVPGDVEVELTKALERFAGRRPAALLPMDLEPLDAALRVGKALGDIRPRSPLRLAAAELASALAGVDQPVRRRSRG